MQNKEKIQRLAFSAVMIALSAVLSLIKVYQLPLGGSVTLLSMLPIVIVSLSYGVGWGLCSSFIYSLIQLVFGIVFDGLFGWGLTPLILIGSILFDYIFAYTCLGLAGLFRKKGTVGIIIGIIMVMVFRFIFHFISGIIFFGDFTKSVWGMISYSLIYNGSYMLPEMIVTAIAAAALFKIPKIKQLLNIK